MMIKLRYYLSIAQNRGFFHIVISSFFNKFFVLASTISLNRLLSQEDYGCFSYAYNIISMVMVVSSLGIDVALLQFCCEIRSGFEKRCLEQYALALGLFSNIFFSLLTFGISKIFNTDMPHSMAVLSKMSFVYPLSFLISYCSMILRSRLDNKKYAILTNISSVSYFGCLLMFGFIFRLDGVIIGRYVAFFIPAIVGFFLLGEKQFVFENLTLKRNDKKKFISYGLTITLTNGVSSLLYFVDIYVIGLVTSNVLLIASYKTATIIPNALAQLPVIIVTFIYPYFAKNKDNRKWIIKNTKTIQRVVFASSILIAAVLFAVAPRIIILVFGEQYLSSLIPFRILLVGFVVSAPFRVIAGNIIAMLGKVKVNFVIGTLSCLLNILLDYFFIKKWGGVGAAIATTIVMIFTAFLSNYYLYRIYENEK